MSHRFEDQEKDHTGDVDTRVNQQLQSTLKASRGGLALSQHKAREKASGESAMIGRKMDCALPSVHARALGLTFRLTPNDLADALVKQIGVNDLQ